MKKDCLRLALIVKFFAAAALFAVLPCGEGAALANTDLDRKFMLETIGFVRSWDNVDGLFSDYVATAYKDYFAKQTRFTLQDLSKADGLLTQSKIPYNELLKDTELLGRLAKVSRSHSLIVTKVQKEGARYRFTLHWLHSPQMEKLAQEEFILEESENGKGFSLDEIRLNLQKTLDRMIKKVPFVGTVTGRDNESVTINLGTAAGLAPGDTLTLGTLDEVKSHPLFKEIVDWRFATVGKIVVEQAEDGIAFCRIIEEQPETKIARGQKIIQILKKPVQQISNAPASEQDGSELEEKKPTLGWMSGGGGFSLFSREFSLGDNSSAKSGSGMGFAAAAEGELWLTREWFAEGGFGYGTWSYSQSDLITSAQMSQSVGVSATSIKFGAGYTHLLNNNFFGPKASVKVGYRSTSFSMPMLFGELLAPISFSGLYFGVRGEMPLRGNWGGLLDLEFTMGAPSSSGGGLEATSYSSTALFFGGYYRSSARMAIRAGLDIQAQSADFSSSASLSQKAITIGPSLLYYF